MRGAMDGGSRLPPACCGWWRRHAMPRDGVQLQKVSRSEGNDVNEVVAARERSAVAGREGVRMKRKMWNEREREREVAAKKLVGEDDDAQVEMALGLSLEPRPKPMMKHIGLAYGDFGFRLEVC